MRRRYNSPASYANPDRTVKLMGCSRRPTPVDPGTVELGHRHPENAADDDGPIPRAGLTTEPSIGLAGVDAGERGEMHAPDSPGGTERGEPGSEVVGDVVHATSVTPNLQSSQATSHSTCEQRKAAGGSIATMAKDGTRKSYPSGPKLQMTDTWKRRVIEWLEREDMNNADLAALVDSDQSTIYRMLETEQRTSGLVLAVCLVTGIPLPLHEAPTDEHATTVAKLMTFTPDQVRLVSEYMELLERRAKGKPKP
jgi:hypothetical protein